MIKKIQSYEILETIGFGGMGVVFKARHTFRNEIVAVKSLLPHFAVNPDLRKRFINEAYLVHP